jgi:NAD(P)-dependent dehydrogenase (short-subunit alcohol dehydrogenase family)
MTGQFSGKVVLVTGSGSGIGRAAALAFAREGASVMIADCDMVTGEETAALVKKTGSEAVFEACDVSKDSEVEALIRKTVKAFGRLDYAHNNAGIDGDRAFTTDCSFENWAHILAVNLTGVWLCMKHEIPEMLRHGGGAIVNTASIAGLVGLKGLPAYVASKHGVVGLTKTVALEYAKSGIRCNAVCPGLIRTPMIERHARADTEAEAELLTGQPTGRMGTPEEVAEAVVWLCSDAASFVTGHAMVVDGAYLAR